MVVLKSQIPEPKYKVGPIEYDGKDVRAHLAITRELDGSFSVIVLNLPGCGSCASSEEEAISRTKEALRGMIESYENDNEDVPWVDDTSSDDIPEGAKLKWIMVNV